MDTIDETDIQSIAKRKRFESENPLETPLYHMPEQVIDPRCVVPKSMNYITPYLYVNVEYNIINKVKCSISSYEYISEINSYIDNLFYYRVLFKKDSINNISSKAVISQNIENIVKVYKIYLDYPYYTTIEIKSIFIKDKYHDSINIYRNTTITNMEQPTTKQFRQQFENILFTEQNGYKKERMLDFYSTIIFLYNVIYNTPLSYNNKDKIMHAIQDKTLESSKFTDKIISFITLTNMYRFIYSMLNQIVIKN